jgi:hypothetical protein
MKTLPSALHGMHREELERVARLWGVAGALPPLMWVRPFLEQTMCSSALSRLTSSLLVVGDRDENASCNIVFEALRMFGLNLNMPSRIVATTRRKTAWGLGIRPE